MSSSLTEFLDDRTLESPFGAAFAEATLFTSNNVELLSALGASQAELGQWSRDLSVPLDTYVALSPQRATTPTKQPLSRLATASSQRLPSVASDPEIGSKAPRRLLSVQTKSNQRRVLPGMPCYVSPGRKPHRDAGTTLPSLKSSKIKLGADKLYAEYSKVINQTEQGPSVLARVAIRYATSLAQRMQSTEAAEALSLAVSTSLQFMKEEQKHACTLPDSTQQVEQLNQQVTSLQRKLEREGQSALLQSKALQQLNKDIQTEHASLDRFKSDLQASKLLEEELRTQPTTDELAQDGSPALDKHRQLVERMKQRRTAQAIGKVHRKHCVPSFVYVNLRKSLEDELEQAQMAVKEIELLQIELSQAQAKDRQNKRRVRNTQAAL
eukprot:m.16763 g.16763  ORF g.16763 m.16763 type:complete len:382 (+) comp10609_c0_seq1:50-1195(+)